MSKNPVQVCVKLRPKDPDLSSLWRIKNDCIYLVDSTTEPFTFDYIFDENATNADIFSKMARNIIGSCVQGFNGTIFAYGQTSSGKTYTMIGDTQNPGVMVLAAQEIFQKIKQNTDRQFLLRVGYIEIYNEKICDLLNKRNQDLKIFETATGIATVSCEEKIITCEEELLHYLYLGNKERTVRETDMNDHSSRSHAIFRIIIESRKTGGTDEGVVNQSVLNLVDLAGSERANQTGACGARLKEGGHINKSLLFLSNVINQLAENEDHTYISYRSSKLTRILQASLGGNAMTSIICTIKPTVVEETLSTLNFAMRAKKIKNKPHLNEIFSEAAEMKRLEKEIKGLKDQLEEERRKNKNKLTVDDLEDRIKLDTLQFLTGSSKQRKEVEYRRRTWCPQSSIDKNRSLVDIKNNEIIFSGYGSDVQGKTSETHKDYADHFQKSALNISDWKFNVAHVPNFQHPDIKRCEQTQSQLRVKNQQTEMTTTQLSKNDDKIQSEHEKGVNENILLEQQQNISNPREAERLAMASETESIIRKILSYMESVEANESDLTTKKDLYVYPQNDDLDSRYKRIVQNLKTIHLQVKNLQKENIELSNQLIDGIQEIDNLHEKTRYTQNLLRDEKKRRKLNECTCNIDKKGFEINSFDFTNLSKELYAIEIENGPGAVRVFTSIEKCVQPLKLSLGHARYIENPEICNLYSDTEEVIMHGLFLRLPFRISTLQDKTEIQAEIEKNLPDIDSLEKELGEKNALLWAMEKTINELSEQVKSLQFALLEKSETFEKPQIRYHQRQMKHWDGNKTGIATMELGAQSCENPECMQLTDKKLSTMNLGYELEASKPPRQTNFEETLDCTLGSVYGENNSKLRNNCKIYTDLIRYDSTNLCASHRKNKMLNFALWSSIPKRSRKSDETCIVHNLFLSINSITLDKKESAMNGLQGISIHNSDNGVSKCLQTLSPSTNLSETRKIEENDITGFHPFLKALCPQEGADLDETGVPWAPDMNSGNLHTDTEINISTNGNNKHMEINNRNENKISQPNDEIYLATKILNNFAIQLHPKENIMEQIAEGKFTMCHLATKCEKTHPKKNYMPKNFGISFQNFHDLKTSITENDVIETEYDDIREQNDRIKKRLEEIKLINKKPQKSLSFQEKACKTQIEELRENILNLELATESNHLKIEDHFLRNASDMTNFFSKHNSTYKNLEKSIVETKKSAEISASDKLIEKQEKTLLAEVENRKNQRLSMYDMRRPDLVTYTSPPGEESCSTFPSGCNCSLLLQKLQDLERNLFIRDSQVAALNMELRNHPLKAENIDLKRRLHLQQEKFHIELKCTKQKCHNLQFEIKNLRNKLTPLKVNTSELSVQTESDLESTLSKLQNKYRDTVNICRHRYKIIMDLQDKIDQKENIASMTHNSVESDQVKILKQEREILKNHIAELKRKYESAKLLLNIYRKDIASFQQKCSTDDVAVKKTSAENI